MAAAEDDYDDVYDQDRLAPTFVMEFTPGIFSFPSSSSMQRATKHAESAHGNLSVPSVIPSERTREFIVKKLFTKEDSLQFHKTFGLLALVSFVYRYVWMNSDPAMGFARSGSTFDWLTMGTHMMLSCSALIFHVLPKRILNKPMIIWEEYRIHAIIFSLRCLVVFAFGCLRPAWIQGTTAEWLVLFTCVMSLHLVVDEVTRRIGPDDPRQTTVRVGSTTDRPVVYYGKRMFSLYQFFAVASHLTPHPDSAMLGFNALIAIQSSAFLMTLFRKNLIRWYSYSTVYSLALVLSMTHILQALGSAWFVARVLMAFALRVKFGFSKYTVWSMFMLVSSPLAAILFSVVLRTIATNFSILELGFQSISNILS